MEGLATKEKKPLAPLKAQGGKNSGKTLPVSTDGPLFLSFGKRKRRARGKKWEREL